MGDLAGKIRQNEVLQRIRRTERSVDEIAIRGKEENGAFLKWKNILQLPSPLAYR